MKKGVKMKKNPTRKYSKRIRKMAAYIKPENFEWIMDQADRQGLSVSHYLDMWIDNAKLQLLEEEMGEDDEYQA